MTKEAVLDYGVTIHSSEQLVSEDFDKLIAEALRKGDFRLAIRYSFLKVLKVLQVKGKIDWHQEKTNHDYYLEIPDGDKQKYSRILYYYEYIWYGEFEANKFIYDEVHVQVRKLQGGNDR